MNWYKIANAHESGISMFAEPNMDFVRELRDNGHQVEIVMMSPDEYLDRISRGFYKAVSHEFPTLENWRENMGGYRLAPQLVNKYKEDVLRGDKFPVPSIFYGPERMASQEGHHRAEVAKQLGVKEMPVMIVDGQYEDTISVDVEDESKMDEILEDYFTEKMPWEQFVEELDITYPEEIFNLSDLDNWYEGLLEDVAEKNPNRYKDPEALKWFLKMRGWYEGAGEELQQLNTADELWNFIVDEGIQQDAMVHVTAKLMGYPSDVMEYLKSNGLADVRGILTEKGEKFFYFNFSGDKFEQRWRRRAVKDKYQIARNKIKSMPTKTKEQWLKKIKQNS